MTEKKINVLLADDHHIVVEGLREILNTLDNITVVGIANNGVEVLKMAHTVPIDLVILDINMPEMDGFQCTRKLKQGFPNVKVLILTMYHDRSFINEMINSGADGCVLKTGGKQELNEAINRVIKNRSYFDSLPDFKNDNKTISAQLSSREIEIIKLIVKGKSSIEIGDLLFISEHTVKTHRKNIFKKLQINNVGQLASIAINRGWSS